MTPSLNNFAQVRQAVADLSRRIAGVAGDLNRLISAKNDSDEYVAIRLVDMGVRIARVTQQIDATLDITNLSQGTAQLVDVNQYLSDTPQIVPVFNISEKIYEVDTLIAVLPVQGSFFVCSDPGLFTETILPRVDLTPPPGDTYLELTVGNDFDLSTAAPPFVEVSDALDGVDPATDEYRLEIECINGVLQFDPGDSDVTVEVSNSSNIYLFGTLDALNAFFTGSTTGFLKITPPVPGADRLFFTLQREVDSREGTYSIGLLATGGSSSATKYDIQIFYHTGSPQTWTKPANAVTVRRYLIGGGAGSGGGRRGASGSFRGGGAGGGGGGFSSDSNPATQFDTTETVTVGGGGTPGSQATANTTDGGAGGAGGDTSMTATGTGGSTLTANGGAGGSGGSTSGGTGGAGGAGTTENGGTGANGNATSVNPGGSSSTKMAGAGGGGGWGIDASNVQVGGSYGGASGGMGGQWGVGAGNSANSNNGFDGHSATAFILPDGVPMAFGGGGGGGAFFCTLTSGVVYCIGGRGNQYGAGAGGGGACTNGATTFNQGEAGAPGIAIVVTECSS